MRRETQGRRMRKVKTYNKKGLGTKTHGERAKGQKWNDWGEEVLV